MKYLLNDAEFFKKMIAEIEQSLATLNEDLESTTIEDMMPRMGFPNNWEIV